MPQLQKETYFVIPQFQQDKDSISQYLEDLESFFETNRFFMPSEKLTEKIVARLKFLDTGNTTDSARDEQELFLQQRMIAEQVYYFTAAMSKSPKAIRGDGLQKENIISPGLCKSIGLSNEEVDEEIRQELAEEFLDYSLQNNGTPVTWGVISTDGEKIFLERFPNEENAVISDPVPEEGVAHYFEEDEATVSA